MTPGAYCENWKGNRLPAICTQTAKLERKTVAIGVMKVKEASKTELYFFFLPDYPTGTFCSSLKIRGKEAGEFLEGQMTEDI